VTPEDYRKRRILLPSGLNETKVEVSRIERVVECGGVQRLARDRVFGGYTFVKSLDGDPQRTVIVRERSESSHYRRRRPVVCAG
jgi:hypothetical protein